MNIQPTAHPGIAALQGAQQATQTVGSFDTVATPAPVEVTSVEPTPSQAPEAAQLNLALDNINQAMQKLSAGVEFSVDEGSNRTIVRVVDQQTKELIRQMPSAETLEIAKALDRVQGLLISLRA